jgi:hypothetical protein
MRSGTRLFGDLLLITAFTWIVACIGLAAVRLKFPSNLLFDQFLVLTVIVFGVSLFITNLKSSALPKSISFLSPEAKFFACMTVSLLFFSTVQYSVLAVDRSRSLYIFSWVDDGIIKSLNGQISIISTKEDPEGLADVAAITQRIQEQTSRGLMSIEGSSVQLTRTGKGVLYTAKFTARFFNLRGWFNHT